MFYTCLLQTSIYVFTQPKSATMANKGNFSDRLPVLGKGSFGKVVKYTKHDGLVCARKIFYGTRAEQNYRVEVDIHTSLKDVNGNVSKNIATIISSGRLPAGFHSEKEGSYYIDFPFIDGCNLESVLKDPPVLNEIFRSAATLSSILLNLLEAVQWVHSRKILHLDIKPDNVMLRKGGVVSAMLIDFGLAKRTSAEAYDAVFGTHGYQPPEFWSLTKNYKEDEKFDIFSLGATLYELLYGKSAVKIEPSVQREIDNWEKDQTWESERLMRTSMFRITSQVACPPTTNKTRLKFDIPCDVHSLVLLLLHREQNKRPTIDQLFNSDLFPSVFPGRMQKMLAQHRQKQQQSANQEEIIAKLQKENLELKKYEGRLKDVADERAKFYAEKTKLLESIKKLEDERDKAVELQQKAEETSSTWYADLEFASDRVGELEQKLQDLEKATQNQVIELNERHAQQLEKAVKLAEERMRKLMDEETANLRHEMELSHQIELSRIQNEHQVALASKQVELDKVLEQQRRSQNCVANAAVVLPSQSNVSAGAFLEGFDPFVGQEIDFIGDAAVAELAPLVQQKRTPVVAEVVDLSSNPSTVVPLENYSNKAKRVRVDNATPIAPFSKSLKDDIIKYTSELLQAIPEQHRAAAWTTIEWVFDPNPEDDRRQEVTELLRVLATPAAISAKISYERWAVAAIATIRCITKQYGLEVTRLCFLATGRYSWTPVYEKVKHRLVEKGLSLVFH